MKFGIMALQAGALVPPPAAQADPQHFARAFDHAALAFELNKAGFNPIELNRDLALFFPQAFSEDALRGLAALKEDGVQYTAHLPIWSVDLSTPLEPVRRASLDVTLDALRAAQPLDPEVYVLHATGPLAAEFSQMDLPAALRPAVLGLFQNNARQSIEALLKESGLPSRKLAVETIEFPLDLTLELAEELDLSVCVDTGHILSGFSGPADLFEVLDRVKDRLSEIHLHDAPRIKGKKVQYGLDHQPLGSGDLDTGRLLNWVMETGFRGPIVFELTLPEAVQSLQIIRELRPTWVDDTEDPKKWRSKLDTE